MLTKRIIPCLDMRKGKVVKGIKFKSFRNAGDPVELAAKYNRQGADELVFLDITATVENRDILLDVVKRTAKKVSIPFSVGGGVRTVDDIRLILRCGADKISINTGGFRNPKLISEGANIFGSQCIVLSTDVRKTGKNRWNVYINDGQTNTGESVITWVKKATALGAGEILLTSIDRDGTKNGFDLKLTKAVSNAVNVPIIASGGAGNLKDFSDVLTDGAADAALAASLFHFDELTINDVKTYLQRKKISVRTNKKFCEQSRLPSYNGKNCTDSEYPFNCLIPVIIQDINTRSVLMLGYMNHETLKKTQEEHILYLWSRARNSLWKKGETSNNTLTVIDVFIDCDQDAILVKVDAKNKAVCHNGSKSCFRLVR